MEKIVKEGVSRRVKIFLGMEELKVFVFFLNILILSWPFVTYAGNRTVHFPFVYFFSVWLALIFFLLISHLGNDKPKD